MIVYVFPYMNTTSLSYIYSWVFSLVDKNVLCLSKEENAYKHSLVEAETKNCCWNVAQWPFELFSIVPPSRQGERRISKSPGLAKCTHSLNRERGQDRKSEVLKLPNKFCLDLKRMRRITKSDTEIYIFKGKYFWFPFSSEAHLIIIETRMDVLKHSVNKWCGKVKNGKMSRL